MNDYELKRELDAMQAAYDVMQPLDEAQRRRAVMWLAAKLGVDMSEYDGVIAKEALVAVESRLGDGT